ncbi:MAG TPA: hypothetical protein VD846_11340 [Allosphingosinicella sp.]|nr:hypothetical protein [Allosphingosinicella sp.]
MSATRLLRFLTLLALLLAPLGMIGGGPAMAHARPDATSPCAERNKPAEAPPSAPLDCMVACAGCLPEQGGALAARALPAAAAAPVLLAFRLHGLHPEAATPPPRVS